MRTPRLLVSITLALTALPCAHAQTYRWMDERGVVIESQSLPEPSAAVQQLEIVEGTGTLSALERRTLELVNEEQRQAAAAARPAEPALATGYPGSPESAVSQGAPPAARARAGEAARDPCLLSPDPRCFEKNARNYDPYLGYAPSALNATPASYAAPQPVGASAGAPARGHVTEVSSSAPPQR